ncbi:MAG TPA: TOMM precursor leader peptide-binding protein [Gaiellaceae bacterium]|nr:TOMM precursor leader peptide-binding protein [Gaiellaceae bacterium]
METVERPLLKPWYRLSVDDGRSTLRYAGSVLEFEGKAAERLLPHLLPLLDGTRTVDDVAAELGEAVRPAVEHALSLLRAHDLLTETAPANAAVETRRCAELLSATDPRGRTGAELHALLATVEVHVLGGAPAAEPIARLLQAGGAAGVAALGWDDDPPPSGLVVAAPGSGELAQLEDWNRRALNAGVPWLQVLPFDGRLAAVGPVFVPGQTACHACFRLRRDSTIASFPDRASGAYPGAAALDAVLAGLAALVAVRWLAAGDVADAGVLIAVELAPELRCTRHFVYRVPRCPACSPAARRSAAAPWSGAHDVAA